MDYIRKHKKVSIIVLVVLIALLTFGFTFGKYVLNITREIILETKGFYFNSSILQTTGRAYSINNWDGVNPYTLSIDVNNHKGVDKVTKADITYDIDVHCSDSVTCVLNKEEGVIYQDASRDNYQITVIPKKNFYEGDVVSVETSVTSNSPYTKKLSATYNIGVEKSKFSYNIEDSPNSKYLTLNFTNSITYYEVSQAFGDYEVGSQISLDDYVKLTDSDKEKCFSAIVTVTFNPREVFLDMTDALYLKRLPDNYEVVKIDGYDYVSKFSFKIDASSSKSVKFYKDEIKNDYTYPIVNESSIIDVSVNTAN